MEKACVSLGWSFPCYSRHTLGSWKLRSAFTVRRHPLFPIEAHLWHWKAMSNKVAGTWERITLPLRATSQAGRGQGDSISTPPARVQAQHRPLRESAQWRLLFAWMLIVLTPWGLQGRSFIQLALPHHIPTNLVVESLPGDGTRRIHDLQRRCPVEGLWISGVWWNVSPTHYVSSEKRNESAKNASGEDSSEAHICHFVIPQYNIHGAYRLGAGGVNTSDSSSTEADKVASLFNNTTTLPEECQHVSRSLPLMSYYFYHGSIGYYAFFESGEGVFCSVDATGYVPLTRTLGSTDLNGDALANDNTGGVSMETGNTASRRWSRWYVAVGFLLLSYRALVVFRSFLLCWRFGARCDRLHEALSLRCVFVFANESARLVAHGANNKHRACILYFLIEGLMGDLFLLVARDGNNARTQYVSLGYNLASLLSLLFEMLESSKWIGERSRCIVRRLFFNAESGLIGELLCAVLLHYYLTTLNRTSEVRLSLKHTQTASFYVASLCGHGMIVLGLGASILTVRSIGGLVIMRLSLGSVAALEAPNCVDQALRGRVKHTMLRGYRWRDQNRQHLVYTRDALKAFGLLQMRAHPQHDNTGASERRGNSVFPAGETDANYDNVSARVPPSTTLFLVQHHAAWVAPRQYTPMDAVGRINGEHVEQCSIFACVGHATFCDRMLGARTTREDNELLLANDELSTQHADLYEV